MRIPWLFVVALAMEGLLWGSLGLVWWGRRCQGQPGVKKGNVVFSGWWEKVAQ